MATTWDAIVIGSGFGGAVTACRLSEAGMKVLVLERGRQWKPSDYPRKPGDAWIWSQSNPERHNGWIDLRFMDDMIVAQGAGVGGGSLIYANVSIEAKPETFVPPHWPSEITYRELKPHYERVGKMLRVATLPENQLTERYKLMREAAQKAGHGDRFKPVPLAVSFSPKWTYARTNPFADSNSERIVNEQGQEQGTCVHCGNCDIGCQVKAKNTLDLNYIPQAVKHGAEVRPLHLVDSISRHGNRYQVHFRNIAGGHAEPGSETADRVILACGSLGSTELLFRCRDQHRTLRRISGALGSGWSSNGDFLTPAIYSNRKVSPTEGPTITCAIDFLDGKVTNGRKFFVEDGGFPNLLRNYLQSGSRSKNPLHRLMVEFLGHITDAKNPASQVMPWFGQAMDGSDGKLYLGRKWWLPWQRELKLDWDVKKSEAAVQAMIDMHIKFSEATGGKAFVPPTWTVLKNLVTPHPLGGCRMAATERHGVVNHLGEVFNYPRLYVADGAIVPRAVGLNPSRTIAALAERIAKHIVTK